MVDSSLLELLTVVSESLCMINDELVAIVNFADKEIALLLVRFFKLAELLHDVLCVRLQVFEDLGLDLEVLIDDLHAVLHRLVLVVHLVLENLALGLQVGQLKVNLLKHVQFAIGLEDGLLQIFHLRICLLLILLKLVQAVFVIHKSVNDWVNQLLDQVSRFRLNVEPQELKRWIVSCETFKVSRNKTFLLELSLPIGKLKICKEYTVRQPYFKSSDLRKSPTIKSNCLPC